jgi:hypothetical protein
MINPIHGSHNLIKLLAKPAPLFFDITQLRPEARKSGSDYLPDSITFNFFFLALKVKKIMLISVADKNAKYLFFSKPKKYTILLFRFYIAIPFSTFSSFKPTENINYSL